MTFSVLTIVSSKGFAWQSSWEKAPSKEILVHSQALQFDGGSYCQLRPDPQALMYIYILSLTSRPQLRLFLHLLTRVSWLKPFYSCCLLYSSRALVTKCPNMCPGLLGSKTVPPSALTYLILIWCLPWDKKGTLGSQCLFCSCLHRCSKWIKAWLLHLVWLVVLWPFET